MREYWRIRVRESPYSCIFYAKKAKNFSRTECVAWLNLVIPSLHEKCPFSCIRTEYGGILCFSPYSVRMRKKTDPNNSEYGHFLRSPSDEVPFAKCEFFMTRIFLYMNGIEGSVLKREFMVQRKPVFWHILRNGYFQESVWLFLKLLLLPLL